MRTALCLLCLSALLGIPRAGAAEGFPNRAIRLIVPYPPGGSSDIVARYLAQQLTETLGQQVIVDNRQGANAVLGTDLASKAAPDGHTIVIVDQAYAINAREHPRLPYDPHQAFKAVSMLARGHMLLVAHPSFPARTLKELAALARSKPGELSCGSGGPGGIEHFACAAFDSGSNVKTVHVPYKGTGPLVGELLAGQIRFAFLRTAAAVPHVKSSRLRALAVTGEARAAALPDVPLVKETEPTLGSIFPWLAALVPAGTPKEAINRLNAHIAKILAKPDAVKRLRDLGFEPWPTTPEAADRFIAAEIRKYRTIAKMARIGPE